MNRRPKRRGSLFNAGVVFVHLLLAIGLIVAVTVATGLVVAAALVGMTRLESTLRRPGKQVPQH
jgi:hypothetical protein